MIGRRRFLALLGLAPAAAAVAQEAIAQASGGEATLNTGNGGWAAHEPPATDAPLSLNARLAIEHEAMRVDPDDDIDDAVDRMLRAGQRDRVTVRHGYSAHETVVVVYGVEEPIRRGEVVCLGVAGWAMPRTARTSHWPIAGVAVEDSRQPTRDELRAQLRAVRGWDDDSLDEDWYRTS